MNKILLIIQREYLTRVRKKTFIISTILFPLLYMGLIFGSAYLGSQSNTTLKVAVIDSSGYFDKGRIERANQKDSSSVLALVSGHVDSLKANFKQWGYDGFMVIPAGTEWKNGFKNIPLQANKTMSTDGTAPVQSKLNNIWEEIKNEKLGITDSTKNIIENSKINIIPKNINDETANSELAKTIGWVAGFLIYFILLLYGSQVMMGVMEEKTNRIAEVIVSSVKPFQLMLGKIIGIGLVALTQFLLWIIFVFVIYNVTKLSGGSSFAMGNMVGGIQSVFTSINVPLIVFCFGFYLLGGFFFYASLYAAVGSSVNEDLKDAQSLGFPITLIIIFALVMVGPVIKDPNGPLAVWGSIIPFSSPIIMMARMPFGVPGTVPWWQLGVSMLSLILGFLFTTWFAGKIYRTGILMYGKKASWKEMMKWAFRKS